MFTKSHKKSSLRFKQWSRKAYAAFRSIGKHVTIGNLKGIVANTFLGKQKNICTAQADAPDCTALQFDNTSPQPPDELLLQEQHLIPVLSNAINYYKKEKVNRTIKLLLMAESKYIQSFQPFLF